MDIDGQAGSVEQALHELRAQVQAVSKGKREEQLKQIGQCDRLAQRVRHSLDSYKLEQRSLPADQKDVHGAKLRTFEEELKKCRSQVDWKRFDVATPLETSGGAAGEADGEGGGVLNTEQATQLAEKVQNSSMESLARTKKQVLESEQVGISTLGKMHEQSEQLTRIGEENEDIRANLKRSKKLLGQIARSAKQDWCIRIVCLLITVAIVVMVILAGLGQDGGKLNVPDEVRNKNSGGRRLRYQT